MSRIAREPGVDNSTEQRIMVGVQRRPDLVAQPPVRELEVADRLVELLNAAKAFEPRFRVVHVGSEVVQIDAKLQRMARLNRSRVDLIERFQRMIEEYNAGSKNIKAFFAELLRFAQGLNEEERRGIKENLTEEELALFDLLTKPEPELTRKEEAEVKKVCKALLETLKGERLVLAWRDRQQTRAAVRLCIETALDRLPEAYGEELWRQKCELAYQHVFECYAGAGQSVYAEA